MEIIRENDVVTTNEVAEHFEYHLQTARRRLKPLEQDDQINQKDVGERFVGWVCFDRCG